VAPWFDDVWSQFTDPGGLRSRLEQAGVKFTFHYYGDALGNPSGGVYQGLGYSGRLSVILDADLEKLTGWSGGTFHVSMHQIHGPGLSENYIENLMTVSGVEAPGTTRLFNLWIEQKFGSATDVRVGQFTASQEFAIADTADLFVNSAFGWPFLMSEDLPSGGPNYPEATPGARLKYRLNDQFTLMAAIFNGSPAGPGVGQPVLRDRSGIFFRMNDAPMLIAEMAYAYNQAKPQAPVTAPNLEGTEADERGSSPAPSAAGAGLPGTVKLGAIYHTGLFADDRYSVQGGLLGTPGSQLLMHNGNAVIYGIVNQMLWRAEAGSDRGLSAFARVAGAPSDRNAVSFYTDAGLAFKAPIASRPDDEVGVGAAFGRISPDAIVHENVVEALTGAVMPTRDYEATIELTYLVQLTRAWSLQPDFQYIIHPGAHAPNPLDPSGTTAIPNAVVVGVRTFLNF
jgi:porin